MEMKIFKIFGQGWGWGRGRGQGRGQGRGRVLGWVRDGDSDKQTTTDGRTDRFSKANIVSDVAYNTLRQK
jgi:hypothetical protein